MIIISQEDTQEEIQTLGTFLRDHREQKGVSLTDVYQATKISLPILTAIEEDDYERMPAVAFCRGFYSIYADYLELDAASVLERYSQNINQEYASSKRPTGPPVRKRKKFNNYAEPSSISPAAGKSFFLMLCIIAIIGALFYFNWNPIDYISNTFMPRPQTPVQQEQTPMAPYSLEIDFHSTGTLKVTLDDGFIFDKQFTADTSLQYQAQKTIILDMPETFEGNLHLNGFEIPLPKVENGRRRLSLPEDLPD